MKYLLAKSPTREGIINLINEFYFSTGFTFDEKGVVKNKKGKIMNLVKVTKKSKGYVFESIEGN